MIVSVYTNLQKLVVSIC